MRALSIKEPWASLIASGEKTIETRTWKTNYRGPLLVCASKRPKRVLSGCAIAVVELVDCRPMVRADEGAARCNYYYGAYAWELKNVRQIKPFSVEGKLGLFNVDYTPAPAGREE